MSICQITEDNMYVMRILVCLLLSSQVFWMFNIFLIISTNEGDIYIYIFFFLWCCDPTRVMASSFLRFLDHTQRLTTVGRTPLDDWSARRRDLYLTTHNTHNRQTSMPPVGFEPKISAGERPQTYSLDRANEGDMSCEFPKKDNPRYCMRTAVLWEVILLCEWLATFQTIIQSSSSMVKHSKQHHVQKDWNA